MSRTGQQQNHLVKRYGTLVIRLACRVFFVAVRPAAGQRYPLKEE